MFTVDLNFDEDKWIEARRGPPGAPEVVHHILAFIVPPGKTFIAGSPSTPVLCGMAPGESPMILPKGMAKLVPKGSRIVFQIHYTPNGRAQKDRSSIALVFAKQRPRKWWSHGRFTTSYSGSRLGTESRSAGLVYLHQGRLHHRCHAAHASARQRFPGQSRVSDGKAMTLLSVPRFNFNWQSIYCLAEPCHAQREQGGVHRSL